MSVQALKGKRLWVAGLMGSFGLLIAAFYYLLSSLQAEKEIDDQIDKKVALRQQLENADPHVGFRAAENLTEAKTDEERVNALRNELKKQLMAVPAARVSDSREFKVLLDNTQAELRRKAQAAGVQIPESYNFTFDHPKQAAFIEPAWLQRLSQQLAEVNALCESLFAAQIHSLESVRRAPVTSESSGHHNYLPRSPVTNSLAVLMPYEVIFKTFSAELASLIDRLARSSDGFIVRSLNTEVTAPSAQDDRDFGPATTDRGNARTDNRAPSPPPSSPGSEWDERYGLLSTRIARPLPALMVTPARFGPVTVISEQPLRVTMLIDAVRLKSGQ